MSGELKADIQQKSARVIGRPFPKGVSGNPAGRPKRKTLTELIHAKLDSSPDDWQKIVELVVTKIIKEGDKEVLKTFWQYTDGMPKQAVDLTSKGEQVFSGANYIGESDSKTDKTSA